VSRAASSLDSDAVLARLRLRDLALLLAIDEHRSITAAARHLGYTQPTAGRSPRNSMRTAAVPEGTCGSASSRSFPPRSSSR